jgi:hypothetical protein
MALYLRFLASVVGYTATLLYMILKDLDKLGFRV